MERRDARLFQHDATVDTPIHEGWNIVELESHRRVRQTINELIEHTNTPHFTSKDLLSQLEHHKTLYGVRFLNLLVRALNREDEQERQAIVFLLTILDDPVTISPLERIASSERYSRSVRLSASFALAGMGATHTGNGQRCRKHGTHFHASQNLRWKQRRER